MSFPRLLSAAFLLAIFTWSLALLSVYTFGRRDEARQADTIVVLGAAQYDGRPSPVLRARLDHAIALYHQGLAPNLILTGGVGVGDTVSEAEVGRRYAIRHGIAAEVILLERGGASTDSSMHAVATLMQTNDLSSALLVSDPFHMYRLRILASRLGIQAHSSPTRSSPIDMGTAEEWRYVFRETLILPSLVLGTKLPPVIARNVRN
jgi:uncharacterized SAM-binding protein YcdF (DUF218 family)